MLLKYATKPCVIEAYHLLSLCDDVKDFLIKNIPNVAFTNDQVLIPTLEGTMAANIGDMIIKGLKGEWYPCKEEIFRMKYDLMPL